MTIALLEQGDCQAKGVVERLQGFAETSFEPGRAFVNELDFQDQLDRWFSERANVRLHRSLRRLSGSSWNFVGDPGGLKVRR